MIRLPPRSPLFPYTTLFRSEISIDRPGGDYRASAIEEVTVVVTARDQFGLHDVRLHYSVNGGPTQDVNLLKSAGAKSANRSEEHTSELQSLTNLVCRLLLEK